MRHLQGTMVWAAAAVMILLSGCATTWQMPEISMPKVNLLPSQKAVTHLQPADFTAVDDGNGQSGGNGATSAASQPQVAATATNASTTDAAAESLEGESTAAAAAPPVLAAPPTAAPAAPLAIASRTAAPAAAPTTTKLTMDAMVGQINGKPIYANAIFRDIGEDLLKGLGESNPRLAFKTEFQRIIIGVLRDRITNALILAEAERTLTEREHLGLASMVEKYRESVLARFGGVLALAEDGIYRETGWTLDEELERKRQEFLTGKYIQDKIRPKIVVNRREVERYYFDHPERFKAATTVTLRMIQADARDADSVDEELKAGKPFAEVARQYSIYKRETGGLMEPFEITGQLKDFNALNSPLLNEKIRSLQIGQHSNRTPMPAGRFAWIKVESAEGGQGKNLQEAFLQIENELRAMKYNRLQLKYIEELWVNGNFTPLEQMVLALTDVAMARYARPQ